jgi:hypothetical protein
MTGLAFGNAQGQAPPVDGTWEISWDMPGGSHTITLQLHQEGNVLNGTAHMPAMMVTGEDEDWQTPISDGRIEGDHVFFRIPLGLGMEEHMQGHMGADSDRVLQFNGVVGSRGVMGGFLTGASMMQGVMTGGAGNPAMEIPFKGFRRE